MTGSNRRLVLFLVLAIAPLLVLVLGPFRARFFPSDVGALRELARVEPPHLDAASVPEFADDLQAQRWERLVQRLDALPPERVTPELMYLHGSAALMAHRPAVALAGLDAASRASDPELAHAAKFALAQAFLLLDRGDAARALLRELAASGGARAGDAAAQLERLAPSSRGP